MKILAIETSCDETAAAVVEKTNDGWVRVLGEAVASSNDMHVKTGGIVPEVASREQLVSMMPVVVMAIQQAIQITNYKLQITNQVQNPNDQISKWVRENIDAVAVTSGPGLIGSLLVGVETAKTLALAWSKPLMPVNHILGHLYANFISVNSQFQISNDKNILKNKISKIQTPEFPLVGLIVSGGHTELIYMEGHGKIQLLGSTRDDAAGECLDKCARLMGLPYPGGPAIAAIAEQNQNPNTKNQRQLPRPLLHEDTCDFSFSGLKIAVLREVNKFRMELPITESQRGLNHREIVQLAWELQEAVVECLVGKLMKAVKEYRPNNVLLAGGVAANSRLREEAARRIKQLELRIKLYIPEIKYCTDNAVMVGAAGIYNYSPTPSDQVRVDPGLMLTET